MLKRFLDPPKPVVEAEPAPPSEAEVTASRLKSYAGAAVLTFVLYLLGWVPGFLANVLFYREAKERERIAGRSLPGVGLLSIMLWANVVIGGLLILIILL